MKTSGLNFGEALIALQAGESIFRKGWNGKGLFLTLQVPDENSKMTRPYIYMTIEPGSSNQFGDEGDKVNRIPWLASQTDLLATDWELITQASTQ